MIAVDIPRKRIYVHPLLDMKHDGRHVYSRMLDVFNNNPSLLATWFYSGYPFRAVGGHYIGSHDGERFRLNTYIVEEDGWTIESRHVIHA
jgi:hypothetical protein